MTKLLVIAPYPGLGDLFLEVNHELGKNLRLVVGDLWQGVRIAKELESDGFDVIISRGATANLLRKHCRLPVVEVKISGYDILRTLTLVKGFQGKVGLMSYWNTIQGAEAIGSLLGMNMTYFPVKDEAEVEALIKNAIDQNIELMVGDVISTFTANQFGMRSILITSGKEAVAESIQEAEQMAFYTNKSQERIHLLESILNQVEEALIALDHKGDLILLNDQAKRFFAKSSDYVKSHPIQQLKEALNFGDEDQYINRSIRMELGEEEVEVVPWPLEKEEFSGGVLFVIKPFDKAGKKADWLFVKQGALTHFNHLISQSPLTRRAVQQGLDLSKSDCPLLIYGEKGTGKRSLAEAIHQASSRRESPFMVVRVEQLTYDTWKRILFGARDETGAIELVTGGTVYVENAPKIPIDIQDHVMEALLKTNPLNVRVIFSSHESLDSLVEKGSFHRDLYPYFNESSIYLPPLRGRKEEMEEMIRWFIASYNEKQAKQIAGCTDEAVQFLRDYDWPGNLMELRTVIDKACQSAAGPFIQVKDIQGFIGNQEVRSRVVQPSDGINLTGKTLKEIEREIILRVMDEEQQNQSQAAKRLGINRSTLWRKLKED